MVVRPTHIELYDIVDKRCLQEFDLEPYGMNVIFSIFPAAAPANEIQTFGSAA